MASPATSATDTTAAPAAAVTATGPVRRASKPAWRSTAGLLALSLIPVAAGSSRLAELSTNPTVTPDNARFVATPLPVVLHIIGATLFCVLGPFQFNPRFRRARPAWHRRTGRLLVLCGLDAAFSGLWMTFFSARPKTDGDLLAAFRLVFGSAMALSIVLAFLAIRRRNFTRHRAWMTRGYAIGIGAGTQVFTTLPWVILIGTPGQFAKAMLMAAGWLINLAAAEWIIRRPAERPIRAMTHSANQPSSRRSPVPIIRHCGVANPGSDESAVATWWRRKRRRCGLG